jgi:hypothetical protein
MHGVRSNESIGPRDIETGIEDHESQSCGNANELSSHRPQQSEGYRSASEKIISKIHSQVHAGVTPLLRQVSDPVTDKEKIAVGTFHVGHGNPTSLFDADKNESFKSLYRSFSTRRRTLTAPILPLFYCKICLENNSLDDAQHVLSCTDCHNFCHQCLAGYVRSQINDGIVKIICPEEHCDAVFTVDEIKSLVSSDVCERFLRFQFIKNNPDYRECSRCNISLLYPTPSSELDSSNCVLQCSICNSRICFFHGDSHPSEDCKVYMKRVSSAERAANNIVRRTTRRCPQCKAPTEKNGGCNHMVSFFQYCDISESISQYARYV